MKRRTILLLSILSALTAFLFFWQINSHSYARTLLYSDDPTYNNARSNITNLLASKNYRQALTQTGNTILYVARKRSQPKFLQNYELMEMTELAAQAYTGVRMNQRALLSHQQIIVLYPFPKIESPSEEARWNQVNGLAINAVHQLINDYRGINQIDAGIAYFEYLQKKYANSPLANAAAAAEKQLRRK